MNQLVISVDPKKIDRFWIWVASKDHAYVLVEEYQLAHSLMEQFNHHATYEQHGFVIGWQFLVPQRLLPLLVRRYQNQS